MAEATPPRRRWFQFSLRTMFVVVTMFALWLGWEAKGFHERQRLRVWAESVDAEIYRRPITFHSGSATHFAWYRGEREDQPDAATSMLGRLLGEEPIGAMVFPMVVPEAKKKELIDAFPQVELVETLEDNDVKYWNGPFKRTKGKLYWR